MKTRKILKAIGALAAGLSMVGATLLGAMATDLSSYPAPFVKSGQWDGVIVVGSNAAAEDVVGAINIGNALQYDMKQTAVGIPQDPVINVGAKIEKTGNKFNYGDSIYDITPTLDSEDLPVILSDGSYKDTTYTQKLVFSNSTEVLKSVKDKYREGKPVGDYLFLDNSLPAYTYNLEFDTPVEFDTADDLIDTSINMQGSDYTVTDVKLKSNMVDEIKLFEGDTTIWLQQGKTITRNVDGINHNIEVTDVAEDEDSCGVSVDGDVSWIDVHKKGTINGVTIGISNAVAVHAQLQDTDICQINLGATEIDLKNGNEVKVNGQSIDGTEVAIDHSQANELNWLTISAEPKQDTYLANGETWTDTALGNFGVRFAGMSEQTESMSADTSSDSATFDFVNNNGKNVEVPLIAYGGNVYYGDADTSDMKATISNGQRMVLANGDSCTGTVDAADCEGLKFLAVSSGKEAEVFEVSRVDLKDGTVNIRDTTSGRTYSDKAFGTIDLKLVQAGITLSADNKTLTFNNIIDGSAIATKYLADISLNAGPSIAITEDDGNVISFGYIWDTNNEDIEITNVTGFMSLDKVSSGSSDRKGTTAYGAIGDYNADSRDSLTISYPEDQAYGNVFVAPTNALVSASGINLVTIDPIINAAKLDTEIADPSAQNMIVIGGPCANSVAKALMNSGNDCTAGFTPGKAIIKLYENGDKVAMLVAGYSAADTRLATQVVSDYGKYNLKGTEFEVSGIDLANVKINAVN